MPNSIAKKPTRHHTTKFPFAHLSKLHSASNLPRFRAPPKPPEKQKPDPIVEPLLFVSLFKLLLLVRLLLYISVGVLLEDIAVSSCKTLGFDDICSIFDFVSGKFNL